MSPILEFEGKNVDKAVEIACQELNLSKDQLRFDVLSYGSSGIFGLVGVKKARIKVTVPDVVPAAKSEKQKKPVRTPSAPVDHSDEDSEDDPASDEEESFDDSETESEVSESQLPVVSDEALETGMQVLKRIIDFITSDAVVSVEKQPERLLYLVNGGNSGVLIGRHGQTLEAIQYLIDKIVNKRNEQRVRVQVDIEGYMENRLNQLKQMAVRLAEKAKKSGKPVTVGQLSAHDRRIVHIALRDDSSVRTQSTGEGQHRRLIVYPKKAASRKQK